MVGSRSWIGGLFNRTNTRRSSSGKFVDYPLSPVEEEKLQRLQEQLQVPYDETSSDHQEALRTLWHCSFPNVCLSGLISDQWKDIGWQGPNPSTDFRGRGFISLENLLFFARTYPSSFHRLILKKDGNRATYGYSFAVAGINISFMLIQMLDLCSGKPRCIPGMNFVKLLGENEEAFNILYCIALEMMDVQWLAMNASYMIFNVIFSFVICILPLSHLVFQFLQLPKNGEKNGKNIFE
ncbi:PREDICTED: ELMO domain-containing protein 2-like [Lupinus angustifolius]|uniref:ELMO domain-containing protein 2-like n=1 Tax=Lupinus angustifolius TaxID=3871 RepID=UPI00092EEC4E|nr:PREDICTED: ELMO domain-containing protein 2-like [Lupinus angustifolius]